MFQKSRLAKRLGLENQEKAFYQVECESYMEDHGYKDYRRILWLLESIADKRAEDIIEKENELIHAEKYDNRRVEDIKERLQGYIADFRFTYSLWKLYQTAMIEEDARAFAESFKSGKLFKERNK